MEIAVIEVIPNDKFQNLKTKHWYRWTWEFDLDSNKITEVSIKDLHTGDTATYEPQDRYLSGGENKQGMPTGFRYFAGSTSVAGNTMAFDNLDISSEGGETGCNYTLKKKVKAKGGCETCPSKGDTIFSGDDCEKASDCERKFKPKKKTIQCPDGKGKCKKIIGKGRKCKN